jgi:uncharacterized protein
MQARRDAILNLSSLLHHSPGSEIEVEAEGLLVPTDDLLQADGLTLSGPLEWNVRVFNTGGDDDFIVDGDVSGVAVLECRRCLTDVEVDVETEFVYPMLYRPSDLPMTLDELDDDEEERLVFGNPQVDFAPLLTQLFAIEVPLTALCKPDCLGLDEDGVNLNEHPERAPSAAARTVSPQPSPFADLEEVFKDIDITS